MPHNILLAMNWNGKLVRRAGGILSKRIGGRTVRMARTGGMED